MWESNGQKQQSGSARNIQESTNKDGRKNNSKVTARTVSISSFVTGTFLGWPSSAIPQIKDGSAGFSLTDDEVSWMVALAALGSFISPIPCGYLIDKLGRRNTLIIFDIVALTSWGILAVSKTAYPIYLSRFLCGLWCGVEYTAVMIYVCEVSEPRLRGGLASIAELMLFGGAFFESAISYLPYQTIIRLSVIPPALLLLGFFVVPESPYYYLMKGNRSGATEIVTWLKGACLKEDMDIMEDAVNMQLNNTATFSEIFTSNVNLKAFLIVQSLKVVVGSSSLIMLMSYCTVILPDSFVSAQTGYVILCCVWVVAGVTSCLIMDKVNRRTFLYVSSVGTVIPMTLLAVWYFLRDKTPVDTSTTTWIPLIALIVAGVFETGGIFNVPNVIKGEIFAINIKSKACALCCMTAFFFEGLTNFFFYAITNNIGMYINFVKIAITSALCIVVVRIWLIETRGKSLEEIQDILNSEDKLKGKKNRRMFF